MKYKFDELVVDSRTGLNPRKNFVLGKGSNNYITIKDIRDGKIVISDKTDKVDDEAIQIIKKRSRIKNGDILFSSIGRVGDTAIVVNKDDSWDVNESVFVFTINKDLITPEYFCYLMSSKSIQDELNKNSTGSTFKSVKMGQLQKMVYDVPIIEEQILISKQLKKSQLIIQNKKQQLFEFDQLIKSRFVEMFGDIFTNEKGYRIGTFNDFVTQMNIGPFGSALKNDYFVSKEDGYCMVYEQKHAIRKNIDVDRRYVDLKKYNELSRFEVGPGDLIVSCRGTIGECHILPNEAPRGIIHPSLMMIKPKSSVNGKFLLHLLERILERQLDNGSGVKMAIQAKKLAKVKTIVPDRHLQDNYILFVEKVDKLKFEVQKSLSETQMLFDALMQEYFG